MPPSTPRVSDALPTTKPATTVCRKCGTIKKTGLRSCCANDGAWADNCGMVGEDGFDHTWAEGVIACKSKYGANINIVQTVVSNCNYDDSR